MKNTVITIGRQYGSGGHELGEKLAKELGFEFYDNNLVKLAAEKSNICPEISKLADEKAASSLLYSIAMSGGMRNILSGHYEMPINDKLFIAQAETIKKIAHDSSSVIVGRCANYVLQSEEDINLVNLYIYADMDYRLKKVKDVYDLSDAAAKDKIIKADKKRRAYYNYYSSGTWGDASEYDLCINIGKVGPDAAIRMIKEYVKNI